MADFIFPLRHRPQLSYKDGGRGFGDGRPQIHIRKHAGCDLIAPKGTEILAMADGTITEGPYYFFSGTNALEIKHDNGMVIRYCEISTMLPRGISRGARVSKGQVIAYVGRLHSGSSMLHLEMYEGTRNGALTQPGNIYKRRSDLVDPTPYLDGTIEPPLQLRSGQGRVNNKVTSTLNVRDQASASSAVLFTLSPGSICDVLAEVTGSAYAPNNQTKWCKIKHGEKSGFAAAYFLDYGGLAPETFIVEPSLGRVNHRVSSALNVRQKPTTASEVVFTLSPDATFKVLEEVEGQVYSGGRTDWCKLEYDGKTGFAVSALVDINLQPRPLTCWDKALPKVPTGGASAETASQDNLPPGVQSSQLMAEVDLERVEAIADKFCTAAARFGVPAAVLAALASRESRCGKVLQNGWGVNSDGVPHAFGIMQVDKNSWEPEGLPDPFSQEHIEQATGIFAQYLDEVKQKHPSWEDQFILKGAAVAYNAGVKTVQTIERMDIGTTGDDYGSDVMARAQYYANHARLSMFRADS